MSVKYYFSAPPTGVHLRVPGDLSALTGASVAATSGTEVDLECVATGGNPAPALQWYLGGERLETGETVATEVINDVTGETVSSVKIPVNKHQHGQEVRCEVIHEALVTPLETKSSLDIQCK